MIAVSAFAFNKLYFKPKDGTSYLQGTYLLYTKCLNAIDIFFIVYRHIFSWKTYRAYCWGPLCVASETIAQLEHALKEAKVSLENQVKKLVAGMTPF